MKYLKEASNNYAYGKVGIYGGPGSGKTLTAALIAIGLHKYIKSTKPIAIFDTEPGHQFIKPLFDKEGIKLYAHVARSFVDLMGFFHEAQQSVDIVIADSITHPWKELQKANLEKINEQRKKYNRLPINKLEFQHWEAVKNEWGKFTTFYLSSPLHIIVCGRAGSIYEYQENEDTGKKELITSGTKMATEKEMGYEPSLLIEMLQIRERKGDRALINRAFIEKDRARILNGREFDFPTFDTFKPHFDYLNIGGEHFGKMPSETSKDLFTEEGNDQWQEEKRKRQIITEEIQGLLLKHHPGQDGQNKKARADLVEKHFKTRSWTKVENTKSDQLSKGLDSLRTELEGETANV